MTSEETAQMHTENPTFKAESITARLANGEEVVVWNRVKVTVTHDAGPTGVASRHNIRVPGRGEAPRYITPQVRDQLREIDVYPQPTVVDPADEGVDVV